MRARGLFKTFLSKQLTIFNLLSFLYLYLNMKRSRTSGGSVTGGTGDIKPQVLTVSTTASAGTDDYSVQQVNLPVPRFGTMKTKATVFELLKIEYYPRIADVVSVSKIYGMFFATQLLRAQNDTCTAATLAADVLDPVVFGYSLLSSTVTTSGSSDIVYPLTIDMTDQNGNGFVIATDRLFFHVGAVADTTVGTSGAKLTYRLVNIGITEYVGIVQSQQG